MSLGLWYWFRGYLTFQLKGPGLERFLNKITALGIILWRVERLTSDVIIARLQIKEFRRLRPLLPGANIKVAIFDRHGLPFLLHRLRPRSFLLVGLVGSLLILFYFGGYIWFIEVSGCEALPTNQVRDVAQAAGLYVGAHKKGISVQKLEAVLLSHFDSVVWAQVAVRGVKAEIRLAEKASPIVDITLAGHIYAAQGGLVTEVLPLRGTPFVEAGETVQKGDLLISGEYYNSKGERMFGRADGIVKARVWYESWGEAPFQKWEAQKTGLEYSQYLLRLGPFVLSLGRSRPLSRHLREEKEFSISLGKALLPLSWTKVKYHKVEYNLVPVPPAAARQLALLAAWERLEAMGITRQAVLKERLQEDPVLDAEGLRISLFVEVEEDIAQFRAAQ